MSARIESADGKMPPPGIDPKAYTFALAQLARGDDSPPGKVVQNEVARLLSGIKEGQFLQVADYWLQESGRPRLTIWDITTISNWLHDGYPLRLIAQAIDQAKESGKPLFTCNYITPRLSALAQANRDARVGGQR